mgnify:CR=1 FL=1
MPATEFLDPRGGLADAAKRLLRADGEAPFIGRRYASCIVTTAEPLSADLPTAVGQLNGEVERLIRECPQQYLWGYARYKNPRQA